MFRKVRDILALNRAYNYWSDMRKEMEMKDAKNLFLSKTFWLNALGLATTLGGLLPQKYAVPVLAVANILNRLVTNQPVNILPK